MRTPLCRSSTIVVLLVALASGCSSGGEPGPTASTSPSNVSPSATSSITPSSSATPSPSQAEKDLAGAEEAVTRFWAVLDEVATSPEKDQNVLATVARAQALAQWQKLVADDRAAGLTQTGRSEVGGIKGSLAGGTTFDVKACVDVSGVDVLDANGKSVVAPGRPDRQRYTYAVEKAPQGFFVTRDTLKGEPC